METLCSFENWSLRRGGIREVVATGGFDIYNLTLKTVTNLTRKAVQRFDKQNKLHRQPDRRERGAQYSYGRNYRYKSTLNLMDILKSPSGEARFQRSEMRVEQNNLRQINCKIALPALMAQVRPQTAVLITVCEVIFFSQIQSFHFIGFPRPT